MNFAYFKKLGKLGFNLDPEVVEHPGKAFCKFILVQANNKRKIFYLEFVHIGKGGDSEYRPGLSFSYLTNLEKFGEKIKEQIPLKVTHKNYKWKVNSTDRLPGWNMLTFKNAPIKNITTWFTEYEIDSKVKKRSKTERVKAHPNTVYSIHGIKLTITKSSKLKLEKILGKKLKSVSQLSDGSYLYLTDGKKDKFESIILNCKKIEKLLTFSKRLKIESFEGFESVIIENNSKDTNVMWNVVVIEN